MVTVELPLRGEWTAINTPAEKVPSHGTDFFAQTYAYDFLVLDERRRPCPLAAGPFQTLLVGARTSLCYAWSRPAHACFDGTVARVVDGIKERVRVYWIIDVARLIKNKIQFEEIKKNPQQLAGNMVTIQGDGIYALYAHLRPNSTKVKVGDRVRAGDIIGEVGHSGNSTMPHLHFQLMDGEDPLKAKGVPCEFRSYEEFEAGGWRQVASGMPRKLVAIRVA